MLWKTLKLASNCLAMMFSIWREHLGTRRCNRTRWKAYALLQNGLQRYICRPIETECTICCLLYFLFSISHRYILDALFHPWTVYFFSIDNLKYLILYNFALSGWIFCFLLYIAEFGLTPVMHFSCNTLKTLSFFQLFLFGLAVRSKGS